MDRLTRLSDAAAEIIQRLELAPDELADRLTRARDIGYWQHLVPDAAIGRGTPAAPLPIADDALSAAAADLRHDRYFRTPPLIGPLSLATINRAIDIVIAAGWPPVFAMVYDELWDCCRLPAIAQLLEGHLGAGYRQIPHLWVHIVPAVSGAMGWMPHFDGFRKARLSIWLALTDATADNGCIHLVPPDTLPDSFRTTDVDEPVLMRDVLKAMQGTRALPVPAGGALGWEFDVFHWGGRATNPRQARRAISMEFLAAAECAEADETPLLAVTAPLPDFATRLRIVASGLQTYAKREPGLRRFRALADRLAE
ncbi:MAG: protein involved in biosynthesis of mitomycin antibiotics/polyketide fumonisin [Acidobacteria bacterium]|nr:protein involved in biosynthesis of mitomycin antibiotics/polyketide fumonisin [Acidobacteriota bacterium]